MKKTNIIIQAFLSKIISDEWVETEKEELYHLCQHVNYNKIPDRTIADNEEIQKMIPWERVERMKIIRLIARNIKIADFVDLTIYNYTIKEIKAALKIHPDLINKINIDLNKINHEDAFILLTIGHENLTRFLPINNHAFTAKETYEIIECNEFSEYVINNLNIKHLKDYHVCDIIINTGDLYFEILDLDKLTARKWLEILYYRPELINYCNFDKFKTSDIYNSVELVCLFPSHNFHYLIKERNFKNELSALGWQKLIVSYPEEYVSDCCFTKLNKTNWNIILNRHPQLLNYKINLIDSQEVS